MGTILSVIDDDFHKEKEFGYINDQYLDLIVKKSDEKSFVCLSYVLGFENTIFNSAQIQEIERELEKLYACFIDERVIEVLDKIRNAIDFSKKDPPSYLLFEGD